MKKHSFCAAILLTTSFIPLFVNAQQTSFDFGLSLTPPNGTMIVGDSLKSAISLFLNSARSQSVVLTPVLQPQGIKIQINPSYCNPPCSAIMTFSATPEAIAGQYPIDILVTGQAISKTITYNLTLFSLQTPKLISPIGGDVVYSLTPLLDWSEVPGATVYQWEAAGLRVTTNFSFAIMPSNTLFPGGSYQWRVRACIDSSLARCSDWSPFENFYTVGGVPPKEVVIQDLKAKIFAIQSEINHLLSELQKLKSQRGY